MGKVGQAGIPHVGRAVRRERLLSAMVVDDRQVVALVAPFGYGKTTLAADYVSQREGDVVWVALEGRSVRCLDVLRRIAEQLGTSASGDDELLCDLASLAQNLAGYASLPSTLVLDDLAPAYDGSGGALSELLRILRPLFDRIVITMREVSADELVALQDALVLDRQHLALTHAEMSAVLELKGLDPAAYGDVEELLNETGGNAGFAALLLESRGCATDFGTIGPHVSAQAMLEASLFSNESAADVELISYACMLGVCTFGELQLLGLTAARERLLSLSRRIPLIRVARTAKSTVGNVEVHHLVSQYVLYQMRSGRRPTPPLDPVLDLLIERDDWRPACDLVAILGTDQVIVSFVERHGCKMIERGEWVNLLRLMSYASPASVLGSACSLLHWAQALHLKGDLDDSLAKASAAHALARHNGDQATCVLATVERVRILTTQGRTTQAIEEAERCLRRYRDRLQGEAVTRLLVEYALALGTDGRAGEARNVLHDARRAVDGSTRGMAEIEWLDIVFAAASTGDWEQAVSRLSPLCDASAVEDGALGRMRASLACALAETGRLDRAAALVEPDTDARGAQTRFSAGPAGALVAAGRGDYSLGVDILRKSRRSAGSGGDAGGASSLLFQSAIERAAGNLQDSLASAERAWGLLAAYDNFALSRLAAAEVAASHASLGDYPAAKQWLEKADQTDDSPNQYHSLCLAAIATVVDHRSGGLGRARLAERCKFVSSGSAAWRMAMYCRAFPELLGILVAEVGFEALPGRMLDLLSVDGGRTCLEAGGRLMSEADRDRLAARLLGESTCVAAESREGAPTCVVGFFGGLRVEVNGRVVGDRDWGKRKARQLFAMLVARRGHEIPRDQILEHLWPEFDGERAKNNFYVAWSSMKAALAVKGQAGGCAFAESKHGRCRARVASVRSELDEFDQLVRELKRAVEGDEADSVQRAVERLASLYRGEFLPGDLYDDWFEQVRVDYRGQFESAMTLAAAYLLARGECADALMCAGRVLALDPLREDLYQVAMRAHLKLGQRNGAIEMFTRCKANLGDELGLDPSDATQRLYERVLELGDD